MQYGNRLVGGGYVAYVDGRKGGGAVDDSTIRFTNNQIGGGKYGDFSFYDHKPVLSGNTGLTPDSGGGTGGGGGAGGTGVGAGLGGVGRGGAVCGCRPASRVL